MGPTIAQESGGPATLVQPTWWEGNAVITGGKGYAPTPMGQVHYRDIGPRDTKVPFFLVHQSPMSMLEFAQIQNAFAEMGIRSIAIDTPGYGNSDRPKKVPTLT